MDAIAALERVGRIGPDPDTFVRPEAGHAGGAGGARVGALTRAGGAPRVVAEHETRVDDEVLIPP